MRSLTRRADQWAEHASPTSSLHCFVLQAMRSWRDAVLQLACGFLGFHMPRVWTSLPDWTTTTAPPSTPESAMFHTAVYSLGSFFRFLLTYCDRRLLLTHAPWSAVDAVGRCHLSKPVSRTTVSPGLKPAKSGHKASTGRDASSPSSPSNSSVTERPAKVSSNTPRGLDLSHSCSLSDQRPWRLTPLSSQWTSHHHALSHLDRKTRLDYIHTNSGT